LAQFWVILISREISQLLPASEIMHLAVIRLGNSEKWPMWLFGLGFFPETRVILPTFSYRTKKIAAIHSR
jgi:hypothetical protein